MAIPTNSIMPNKMSKKVLPKIANDYFPLAILFLSISILFHPQMVAIFPNILLYLDLFFFALLPLLFFLPKL
jgi:hypothetical protein